MTHAWVVSDLDLLSEVTNCRCLDSCWQLSISYFIAHGSWECYYCSLLSNMKLEELLSLPLMLVLVDKLLLGYCVSSRIK